jgi:hypothetical protein
VIRLSLKIRAIVLCNCISRVCKQRRTSTNIGGSVLTSVLIRPFLGLFAGHFIYEKRLGGNRICDYLDREKFSRFRLAPLLAQSPSRARGTVHGHLFTTADRKIHDLQGKIDDTRNEKSRWENTARQAEQY